MPAVHLPQGPVVVLVSANSEWRAVRALLEERGLSPAIHPSPYGEWLELGADGGWPGERIILLHGGWGKIAAAGSTQWAIDCFAPRLLLNLGTCGGFAGRVERGTLVLVEKAIVYDIIEQMGTFEEGIAGYTTTLDLSWLAEPLPLPVRRGLMVSGDRDLVAEDLPELIERYDAVVGDWESGAVAWVAGHNQVPCLILRGVSDLVGPDGGEVYGNLPAYRESTRAIMARLLDTLPAWLAAARTGKSDLPLRR